MSDALTRLVENLDLPPKEAGEAILAYRAKVLREAASNFKSACPEGSGPVRFPLCQCMAAESLESMADGIPF